MLDQIVTEKWLTAKGILGIFPANQVNDDDILVTNESGKELAKFLTLRQQSQKTTGAPNIALADFIAPVSSGKQDYIGCFCVSTGFGVDEKAAEFEEQLDDYNSILVKALGDRMAEAFAEYLHRKVRTEIWGYAAEEKLTNQDLIAEEYIGIRPAPGYPACPDIEQQTQLCELLEPGRIGVELSEEFQLHPEQSTSAIIVHHPEAKYFNAN
jgi:5-methyltetrahydrofolate--homocysteine methyltransferase